MESTLYAADKVDLSEGGNIKRLLRRGENPFLFGETEDWALFLLLHSAQVGFLYSYLYRPDRRGGVMMRERRAMLSTDLLDLHSSLSTLQW